MSLHFLSFIILLVYGYDGQAIATNHKADEGNLMEREARFISTLTAVHPIARMRMVLIMDKAGKSLLHFRLLPNFYNNPTCLLFAKT